MNKPGWHRIILYVFLALTAIVLLALNHSDNRATFSSTQETQVPTKPLITAPDLKTFAKQSISVHLAVHKISQIEKPDDDCSGGFFHRKPKEGCAGRTPTREEYLACLNEIRTTIQSQQALVDNHEFVPSGRRCKEKMKHWGETKKVLAKLTEDLHKYETLLADPKTPLDTHALFWVLDDIWWKSMYLSDDADNARTGKDHSFYDDWAPPVFTAG